MQESIPASHPNTRCVRAACDILGIPYTIHDTYGNFISVDLSRRYFFVNNRAPFNTSSVDKICTDKEFTASLLSDAVRMPKTKGYFDPFPADEQYTGYVILKTYEAIVEDITREFEFPVILKMNSGALGKNVFLCKNSAEAIVALTTIFDHTAPSSDYVALAQEYVPAKKEYRAIVFRGKVILTYEKDISNATFAGNLSPLHYKNAKAVLIEDSVFIERLQEFIDPLFPILGLEFGGLDIIQDEKDNFSLIELNSFPSFAYFTKDNGDKPLVKMYEMILSTLQ